MLKDVKCISDLNFGAVDEQFERAWNELLRNVSDPATEAKCKREIVITVAVVPSEDRNMANTKLEVKTKLAPVKGDVGSVMFDFDEKGRMVARTHEAENQGELFLEDKEVANGR